MIRRTDPVFSAMDERQRLEASAQRFLRPQTEPSFQSGRVHAAEVHCHLEVAVGQVREAWVCPVHSRTDAWASQKYRPGRPVVSPHRTILCDTAAELAENKDEDAFGQP